MAGGRRACGRLGVRIRNGCGSGLHQSLRTHACCRLGSPSGPPPHSMRGPVVVRAHNSNQRRTPPRGASPRASRTSMPPSAARAYGTRRCPAAERAREVCMWVHADRRIKPTESATMSAGRHPSTFPASLGRVPLLHSWRHTRGVHESAGRGFALTQHAHIVIIAVLYTRTTVALAPPQAPSHTTFLTFPRAHCSLCPP